MIPLKYSIFLLILCCPMENASCMDILSAERQIISPSLTPNDSDNDSLPITVHIVEKNQKHSHTTYWNRRQLSHVAFLDNQLNFDNNEALIVPGSQVPLRQFQTIEKITRLLPTAESTLTDEQQEQIEECFKNAKQSPHALYSLWSATDYLNCSFVYNSCFNHLCEKIKSHLDNNRIDAVLELIKPAYGTRTAYLGYKLLETYQPLKNFLMRVGKQQQLHEETNDWYSWDYQDNIMFKTLDSAPETKIKIWFDGKIYIISPENKSAVYRSHICPTSKKFFCLFEDSLLEVHDLTNETLLSSHQVSNHLSAICYSPTRALVSLIDQHTLRNYTIAQSNESDDDETKKSTPNTNTEKQFKKMKAFTYDESAGVFYIAFEKEHGIFQYDPSKNILEKYFYTNSRSNKRTFSSLCLSHDKKILYSLSLRKYRKGNQIKQQAELCLWHMKKRKLIRSVPLWGQYSLYHMLLSPDDSLLVFEGYRKDKIIVHDAKAGNRIALLNGCYFPVSFSSDSKTLAATTYHGFIEHSLYDASVEKKLHDYSAQHIALLAACAKPRAPHRPTWNKMEQDIKRSETMQRLLAELPESLKSHLNSFVAHKQSHASKKKRTKEKKFRHRAQ